jgi:hypothetical protein
LGSVSDCLDALGSTLFTVGSDLLVEPVGGALTADARELQIPSRSTRLGGLAPVGQARTTLTGFGKKTYVIP